MIRVNQVNARPRRRAASRRRPSGAASRAPLTAFVLSGGGARGAYECGVYVSLHKHGVQPDVLVGTSVGAINAVAIAQGIGPQELVDLWMGLASPDSWFLMDPIRKARSLLGHKNFFVNRLDFWNALRWTYVFDTSPLRVTLNRFFDRKALRRSSRQVIITAVDLLSGECRTFHNDQITVDHMLASASIPVLFPWTRVGNELLWDGGLLANCPPLKAAIETDPRVRDVFLVKLFPLAGPRPSNLLECFERALEITLQGTINTDIRHCEFINGLIDRGLLKEQYRKVDLHTLEFRENFQALSIIDFDREYVKHLIDQGEKDTDAYFTKMGMARQGAVIEPDMGE